MKSTLESELNVEDAAVASQRLARVGLTEEAQDG